MRQPGRTDLEQKLSFALRWRTKVRREGVNGNRIKNFNLFEENRRFSTLILPKFDKHKAEAEMPNQQHLRLFFIRLCLNATAGANGFRAEIVVYA